MVGQVPQDARLLERRLFYAPAPAQFDLFGNDAAPRERASARDAGAGAADMPGSVDPCRDTLRT